MISEIMRATVATSWSMFADLSRSRPRLRERERLAFFAGFALPLQPVDKHMWCNNGGNVCTLVRGQAGVDGW